MTNGFPKTLGRYQLGPEIGRGRGGVIFKAVDTRLGRSLAIKTLDLSASSNETRLPQEQLLLEAQSVARLNHPNIVTVYDVAEEQGTLYLAMELLDGERLDARLASERPLGFVQIARIVGELADALSYAHTRGITHRDLKPANIILLKDETPKLIDFGLAQLPPGIRKLTGLVMGTPRYMAPEQVDGKGADPRTDVFALGAIMYEMIAKRPAFDGRTLTEVAEQVRHREPPSLSELVPNCPGYFVKMVGRMLEKDPNNRFQSARSVSDRLRKYVRRAETKSALAKRPPRPDPATAAQPGSPPRAASGPAMTATAAPESAAPAVSLASAAKRRRLVWAAAAAVGVVALVGWATTAFWPVDVAAPAGPAKSSAPTKGALPAGTQPALARSAISGVGALTAVVPGSGEPGPAVTTVATSARSPGVPDAGTSPPAARDGTARTADSAKVADSTRVSAGARAVPEMGITAAVPAGSPTPERGIRDPETPGRNDLRVPAKPEPTRKSDTVARAEAPAKGEPAAGGSVGAVELPVWAGRVPRGQLGSPAAGLLNLSVSPWAEVSIDGRVIGTTPPLSQIAVPAGSHRVELRSRDGALHVVQVDVEPYLPKSVRHRF